MARPDFPTNAAVFACLERSNTLSAASRKTYRCNLKALLAVASDNHDDGPQSTAVSEMLCSPRSPDKLQLSALGSRTKSALCAAALAVFKHASCAEVLNDPAFLAAKPAWEKLCKDLSIANDTAMKQSTLSDREQQAWVPLCDWLQMEQTLRTTEFGSRRHLLVAFYSLWPPVRGGDAGRLRIVKSREETRDGDGGVLVFRGADEAAELVISSHKTAKHYGEISRVVPPVLKAILAASLQREPREYVFTQASSTTPFLNESAFNSWANRTLRRLFGRPCTANTARHAYLSSVDFSRLSVEQQETLARWMGHSTQQQNLYRKLPAGSTPIMTDDGALNIPMNPSH